MVASKRVQVAQQSERTDAGHIDTPTRTRVRDLTAFCQDLAPHISQNDIFNWSGVSKQREYEMLQDETPLRRNGHREDQEEIRGRNPIF
jgi:hypothetical protein